MIPPQDSLKSPTMENINSPLASAYLRFLQLARVIQALPDGMEMDANESALLQAVVLRWYENSPMTVREAIGLSTLGSPATLHKRITRLREKEMLSTLNQAGDRRAKFLIPTPRTIEYFSHLGQSMQLVQQNPAA
jgi:DNA-binding MarR family transcriptional regulator